MLLLADHHHCLQRVDHAEWYDERNVAMAVVAHLMIMIMVMVRCELEDKNAVRTISNNRVHVVIYQHITYITLKRKVNVANKNGNCGVISEV
jgi:hypothetical protein